MAGLNELVSAFAAALKSVLWVTLTLDNLALVCFPHV